MAVQMGGNIGKPASSKDGSEKTEFSSNFNQQSDNISTGGECVTPASGLPFHILIFPVDKQVHPMSSAFDNTTSMEQCIMIVLYDFTATLDSQLTVKRGKTQRKFNRSLFYFIHLSYPSYSFKNCDSLIVMLTFLLLLLQVRSFVS